MSEDEAKMAWAEELAVHDAYHSDSPEISCPWCHGEKPTWQDYMAHDEWRDVEVLTEDEDQE